MPKGVNSLSDHQQSISMGKVEVKDGHTWVAKLAHTQANDIGNRGVCVVRKSALRGIYCCYGVESDWYKYE